MKVIVSLIFAAVLFSSCASKFGKILKSKDNEYKLKMAEQYYATKKYDKAQQVFVEVLPYFKGDTRFDDIYYKYAYCSYYLKDYINSENLFKTFTESFPSNIRAEECEYMRCMSFYKQSPKVDLDQTNTSKTIALMQAFINTHSGSERVNDATKIIDECRAKLELKEYKAARLYYDIGTFKAAAVAYSSLIDNYPDSEKSDEYKLDAIKAYFKYAELSYIDKQQERYEKVINECTDFAQRFPESKLITEVSDYKTLSENNIKKIQNEQTSQTAKR